MMYYHSLIESYHNITLCLVRVWTRIAAHWRTVKGGNWDKEILDKWPYPLNTASNILLGGNCMFVIQLTSFYCRVCKIETLNQGYVKSSSPRFIRNVPQSFENSTSCFEQNLRPNFLLHRLRFTRANKW